MNVIGGVLMGVSSRLDADCSALNVRRLSRVTQDTHRDGLGGHIFAHPDPIILRYAGCADFVSTRALDPSPRYLQHVPFIPLLV